MVQWIIFDIKYPTIHNGSTPRIYCVIVCCCLNCRQECQLSLLHGVRSNPCVLFVCLYLFVFFYGLSSYSPPLFQNNAANGYTLLRVSLITRHGDRTPINEMPMSVNRNVVWNCSNNMVESDVWLPDAQLPERAWRKQYIPNVEVLPGNCKSGQLTVVGAQQHQALGRALRSLYVDTLHVLPPTLDSTSSAALYFRSTDIPRTIQSAWNLVEGAWPGTAGLFTLMTMDQETENMGGGNGQACPELSTEKNKRTTSANFTSFYNS